MLISLDTVRADHTSLYGYGRDTTPALRSMWQSGATLYTRAIAASDWTLPSHASIVTGLLATHHGARDRGTAFPTAISPDAPTMAEYLRGAGLRTFGIVANYGNLDPRFGFGRGFDYYQARLPRPAWVVSARPSLGLILVGFMGSWLRIEPERPTRSASDITGEALQVVQLERANAEPFFRL